MLKFHFFEFLLNMVKLLIQEVSVLLNNYSRILVLLKNYFSFFEFWSGQTMVKLWSNNGQTTYSISISVTKELFKNISVTKELFKNISVTK